MSDLNELFSRDPLHHTKESIAEIIEKFRGMRSQFSLENNKKAGAVKKPAAVKTSALAASGVKLDLSGLLKK